MNKFLQKFFQGYCILDRSNSLYNRDIKILEDLLGRRRLVAGGLVQSGEEVEKIWKEGLKDLETKIENCLILGLGAGSAAKLAFRSYPGVKIIGVEIDPEIIRLGKKYFGLNEISDLEIQNTDAIITINNQQPASTVDYNFDLILIDLYLGDKVPDGSEADEFLLKIKGFLNFNGVAIFNRLYYEKTREETDKFGRKLCKYFTKIEAKKILLNKLFLCRY